MARAADFDLAKELAKPSFTPGQRDASALTELVVLGDEPAAGRAAVALAILGELGRRAIEVSLTTAPGEGAAARLVAALGLLARHGDDAARAALVMRAGDPAVRVRRAAIAALGKLDGDDARAAVIARWDADDVTADERRTLAEALGKLGGDAAIARLRGLDPGGDGELARRRDRAVLMADRSARRAEPSTIAIDVAPPAPLIVRLTCKPGLGALLVEDLKARGLAPQARGNAAADVRLDRPWSALHASRLWATAAIRIALGTGELGAAITTALTSPPVRALLVAWTRGPIRWRLGFAHGHKRAIVWRVARDVTAVAPELVNDPTHTTWDVLVDGTAPPFGGAAGRGQVPAVDDDRHALDLIPRRADDPRFAWRIAELPAASHPSVAAALAYVGGARPGDRVWDPFVGSAAELVERARLGPVRSLAGSDLDEAALAAARSNLDAAGVTATLVRADARTHDAGPVDLILTNPPLGSRVQVDAAALLIAALPGFARQLAPGGRLVWITPAPRKTTPVAERFGLRRTRALAVDLGGVRGQLERWERA